MLRLLDACAVFDEHLAERGQKALETWATGRMQWSERGDIRDLGSLVGPLSATHAPVSTAQPSIYDSLGIDDLGADTVQVRLFSYCEAVIARCVSLSSHATLGAVGVSCAGTRGGAALGGAAGGASEQQRATAPVPGVRGGTRHQRCRRHALVRTLRSHSGDERRSVRRRQRRMEGRHSRLASVSVGQQE